VPRRGKRRRLARFIYADDSGLAGVVRVGPRREERRFPLGTPLEDIRRDLAARRTQLELEQGDAPAAGTLAAIVERHLAGLPEAVRHERRFLLQPWIDALGDRPFARLPRATVLGQLEAWKHEGLSASRLNKRISALRVAWRTIAPDYALPHAIERVKRYREPPAQARGIPMPLVTRIIAAMPASASRARIQVLAWTGQPPALVMQIQPHHVRWTTSPPELYVSPRRKGHGSADAWLPLVPPAVTALRAFFRAKATGKFQTSALARAFKRAVSKVQTQLTAAGDLDEATRLATLRLYDLRHSFATWFATETKDQWALAEYLRHSRLETTARYMRGASTTRTTQAVAQLTNALAVPPSRATTTRKNVAPKAKGRTNPPQRRK